MIVSGIYYLGWLSRQYESKLPKKNIGSCLATGFCFFSILIVMTMMGAWAGLQPASIAGENVVVIMIGSLSGCCFVYSISQMLSRLKIGNILAVLGDYSFSIMLLHLICFKLSSWLYCVLNGQNLYLVYSFPTIQYTSILWFFVYLLMGTIIPVILSIIWNKCRQTLELLLSHIIIRR